MVGYRVVLSGRLLFSRLNLDLHIFIFHSRLCQPTYSIINCNLTKTGYTFCESQVTITSNFGEDNVSMIWINLRTNCLASIVAPSVGINAQKMYSWDEETCREMSKTLARRSVQDKSNYTRHNTPELLNPRVS